MSDEPTTTDTDAAPAAPVARNNKERRRVRNAAAPARPSRTPEERQAERDAERKRKAEQRRRYRAKQKAKRAAAPASEAPAQPAPTGEQRRPTPKVRQGIVVSDRADKTITVRIDVTRRHRRYRKIMRSSVTLHAHDETNDAGEGDTVRVIECRPMSATKRWKLVDVLERAR